MCVCVYFVFFSRCWQNFVVLLFFAYRTATNLMWTAESNPLWWNDCDLKKKKKIDCLWALLKCQIKIEGEIHKYRSISQEISSRMFVFKQCMVLWKRLLTHCCYLLLIYTCLPPPPNILVNFEQLVRFSYCCVFLCSGRFITIKIIHPLEC